MAFYILSTVFQSHETLSSPLTNTKIAGEGDIFRSEEEIAQYFTDHPEQKEKIIACPSHIGRVVYKVECDSKEDVQTEGGFTINLHKIEEVEYALLDSNFISENIPLAFTVVRRVEKMIFDEDLPITTRATLVVRYCSNLELYAFLSEDANKLRLVQMAFENTQVALRFYQSETIMKLFTALKQAEIIYKYRSQLANDKIFKQDDSLLVEVMKDIDAAILLLPSTTIRSVLSPEQLMRIIHMHETRLNDFFNKNTNFLPSIMSDFDVANNLLNHEYIRSALNPKQLANIIYMHRMKLLENGFLQDNAELLVNLENDPDANATIISLFDELVGDDPDMRDTICSESLDKQPGESNRTVAPDKVAKTTGNDELEYGPGEGKDSEDTRKKEEESKKRKKENMLRNASNSHRRHHLFGHSTMPPLNPHTRPITTPTLRSGKSE